MCPLPLLNHLWNQETSSLVNTVNCRLMDDPELTAPVNPSVDGLFHFSLNSMPFLRGLDPSSLSSC